MPLEIITKAVKVENSLRMTIPKEVSSYFQLKPGDTLAVTVTDHAMEVRTK